MAVTAYQERRIQELRRKGIGYRTIAAQLGISRDNVRNYCVSHQLSGVAAQQEQRLDETCPNCGGKIVQPKRGRRRRFCSDACCRAWWSAHPDAVCQSPKAQYLFKCVCCGKDFVSYGNAKRRYCCHTCYIHERFRRAQEDKGPNARHQKQSSLGTQFR